MKRIYTIPTAFTEEHISVDYAGSLVLLNQLIGAGIAQESATTTDRSARGPLTRWAAYYLLGTPLAFRDTVMAAMGISTPGEPANLVPGDANPFFNFIDSVGQSGNNIRGMSIQPKSSSLIGARVATPPCRVILLPD